jgi:cobalt-zinc-cadmium efflux system protein
MRDALHILLDNVPKDLDMSAVREAIENVDGVESVHHLHAWSLTSGKNILSTHVLVDDFPTAEHTLHEIQAMLKKDFGIYFSTVQVETEICLDIEAAEEIDFLRQDGEDVGYEARPMVSHRGH